MSYIGTQPVPQSLESRQEFTATASQTTFATSGYTVGYVDVYLNGVKLSTSDFTATNGSDIVLGSGAAAGDVLAVVMKNDHSDLVALPITDSAGNNILSESGGTITLTTNSAVIEGSSSGNLVRITQTGSGNALVVEDSANPDSTPFVVDSSGNVLVGSSSKYAAGLPGNVVQINATGNGGLVLGDGTSNIAMYRDLVNNITYWYNGTNQASLSAAGAWTNASDARLKTNVREIKYGLETVLQTQPRTFERIDVDGTYIGFVAQELQTVIPEVVSGDPEKQLGIDYGSLVAVAFKAIQEQQTLIESQQSQILELTTRIEALETT